MTKRIILGAAMIIVLAALLTLDHLAENGPWRGVITLAILLPLLFAGMVEFAHISAKTGTKMHLFSAAAGILLLVPVPVMARCMPEGFVLSWGLPLCLAAIIVFASHMLSANPENAAERIAMTLTGCLYLGLFGGMIVSLRMEGGIPLLAAFAACVKGTDIGAYFTGHFVGKHKMVPSLSPGKTWEGLAGGLLAAAAAGAGWWFTGQTDWELLQCITFGVSMGIAGQFGDLCESLFKRSAGVKDSGTLLPEFGGVLDILDSLLLAAPVGVFLVMLFGR